MKYGDFSLRKLKMVIDMVSGSVIHNLLLEKTNLAWVLIGVLLISLFLALNFISNSFSLEIPLTERPVIIVVLILILSGAFYFILYFLPNIGENRNMLAWIITVGTVLRAIMLFSTPILENDYFRYLWDGAILANGINPYAYSPDEVIQSSRVNSDVPPLLSKLAKESGDNIHQINYPNLRTVYPPTAQAFFAVAYWMHPWSLFSLRVVFLFFDFLTLALLLYILRYLNLPLIGSAIYWWNPLLVKELFNSAHLDVIALPLVLGAIFLAIRSRYFWSIISLALAIGVKLWPIVLLPIILRPIICNPRRLLPVLILFCILAVLLFLPVYVTGFDASSGFTAYAERWENNNSLFKLILLGSEFVLKSIDIHLGNGQLVTRISVLLIISVWIAYLTFQKIGKPEEVFEKCLLIVAAVFLLSPTQFPWYYTWTLPFLAVCPRPSLLLLTVLLPLYYLRYYFQPRDQLEISMYVIVWIEFVPVWILLIREWYVNRTGSFQKG